MSTERRLPPPDQSIPEQDFEGEYERVMASLVGCPSCGRRFLPERLDVHLRTCERSRTPNQTRPATANPVKRVQQTSQPSSSPSSPRDGEPKRPSTAGATPSLPAPLQIPANPKSSSTLSPARTRSQGRAVSPLARPSATRERPSSQRHTSPLPAQRTPAPVAPVARPAAAATPSVQDTTVTSSPTADAVPTAIVPSATLAALATPGTKAAPTTATTTAPTAAATVLPKMTSAYPLAQSMSCPNCHITIASEAFPAHLRMCYGVSSRQPAAAPTTAAATTVPSVPAASVTPATATATAIPGAMPSGIKPPSPRVGYRYQSSPPSSPSLDASLDASTTVKSPVGAAISDSAQPAAATPVRKLIAPGFTRLPQPQTVVPHIPVSGSTAATSTPTSAPVPVPAATAVATSDETASADNTGTGAAATPAVSSTLPKRPPTYNAPARGPPSVPPIVNMTAILSRLPRDEPSHTIMSPQAVSAHSHLSAAAHSAAAHSVSPARRHSTGGTGDTSTAKPSPYALVPCPHCGRTFFPARLEVHEKSCRSVHTKPVGSPSAAVTTPKKAPEHQPTNLSATAPTLAPAADGQQTRSRTPGRQTSKARTDSGLHTTSTAGVLMSPAATVTPSTPATTAAMTGTGRTTPTSGSGSTTRSPSVTRTTTTTTQREKPRVQMVDASTNVTLDELLGIRVSFKHHDTGLQKPFQAEGVLQFDALLNAARVALRDERTITHFTLANGDWIESVADMSFVTPQCILTARFK